MMLKSGDSGKRVKALQETVLCVDANALPKYGADGDLGGETLRAVARLLPGPGVDKTGVIDHNTQQSLLNLVSGGVSTIAGWVDNRPIANAAQRKHLRAPNAEYDIVWHQADVEMGEKPTRYKDSSAHFFVTSGGLIIQLHDIEWLTHHAHALNEDTIGIEIEGMFAGVEGDLSNASWPQYHKVLGRKPQSLTPQQIKAARDLALWIEAHVAARGGRLRDYYAHRQGSDMRDRDPGQLIWRNIVLPSAADTGCGLPMDRVFGRGRTIPMVWR